MFGLCCGSVGNGGMTTAEYRAHFSLWCLVKSPLLIGCDITNISPENLEILTNSELIAVNQDPLGVQGAKVFSTGPDGLEVWAAPMADGSTVILLLNRSPNTELITADFRVAGVGGEIAQVRNLWTHQDIGQSQGSFSAEVPSHDVVVVRVTPGSARPSIA